MMDAVSTAVIDEFASSVEAPCVSITMPTHRFGRDVTQDPIRLKNLLSQAEHRLVEQGLRPADAVSLLAPARELLGDTMFWSHQEDGLVLYAHRNGVRTFRLPLELNSHVSVGREPDLAPLHKLLAFDDAYWIAAISQRDVRLVRATRFGASEVDLPGVPHSMEDANWFVRREREVRSGSAGRGGAGRLAAFHGSGGYERDEDEDLLRFLRGVDAGLRSVIGDDQAPVVLAGVGSTLADFRRISKLRNLVPDELEGNPEHLSVGELHQRTLPLVEGRLGAG